MTRVLGSIVVLLIVGGLIVKYRDGQSLTARPGTQGTMPADEGLTDPPNWKVELPTSPASARRSSVRVGTTPGSAVASTRYGSNSGNASDPPLWTRRSGKFPPAAPAYLPRDASIEPPHAVFLPKPVQPPLRQPTPRPATGQALVATPSQLTPAQDAVAQEEYRQLLQHAKFLIKAGLAPMAKEPLQQILRGAPDTPVAREARLTLDTIRN
jgi:hypothetical protein